MDSDNHYNVIHFSFFILTDYFSMTRFIQQSGSILDFNTVINSVNRLIMVKAVALLYLRLDQCILKQYSVQHNNTVSTLFELYG